MRTKPPTSKCRLNTEDLNYLPAASKITSELIGLYYSVDCISMSLLLQEMLVQANNSSVH